MMGTSDLVNLTESIKENGLRDPIILFDEQILDGRNRHQACLDAGVEARFDDFTGDDPLKFVVDHNLHRRHLTESQRAMVAASLANLKRGGDRRSHNFKPPIGAGRNHKERVKDAATQLSVGARSVERAKKIQRDGAESLISAVKAGDVTVSAGCKILSLSEIEQDELVEAGPDAVKAKAKELSETQSAPKPDTKPPNVSRMKTTREVGIQLAVTSIDVLKKIDKNDPERVEALRMVIDHCQERLASKI